MSPDFTVDPGGETPEWDDKVGFVPAVLEEMKPAHEGMMVITCGPPIMIKFTLVALTQLGFPMDAVVTTLENRMKCGIGTGPAKVGCSATILRQIRAIALDRAGRGVYDKAAGMRGDSLRSSAKTAAPSGWDPEARGLLFTCTRRGSTRNVPPPPQAHPSPSAIA